MISTLTQRLLTLAAGLALTALPALAADVDGHSPTEGAEGTEITITGEGFLPNGKGKPKVWLTQEGTKKKVVLKVLSASDTEIVALLKKGKANKSGNDVYNVTVFPAVKKAEGIQSPQSFRIAGPELQAKGVIQAEQNEEVTVFVAHLGTKKPKMKVGGKGAKVVDYVSDLGDPGGAPIGSVTFLMPKKLANGVYALEIKTKYGPVTIDGAMEMINSDVGVPKPGKPSFSAKVDGKKIKPPKQVPLGWVDSGLGTTSFSVNTAGNPNYSMLVTLNYDADVDGAANLTVANGGIVSWILGITNVTPPLTIDTSNYDITSGSFNIGGNANGTLVGTCSATFTKTSGSGPQTVQLTDGKFSLPQLQPAP